ncbi:MAG TPA: DUF1641 domain-containing protein [Saprospiraceae bacterium]|nr:DUF1641 domain-containing protein [Saprospiraceae bacterium]
MDTQAGKALEARLNDERVVNAMNRILDRLDVIESSLEKIHEAPGMISMVTDMADDAVRTASDKGVDFDERLRAALAIAEKLTAPEMVDKIDHFIASVDQAPSMVSMVTDMADDLVRSNAERGVDIDERLRVALSMAEKLTEPAMVERIDALISMTDQAPGMVSMAVDIVDDSVRTAAENGVDINERLSSALVLAEKLTSPHVVEQLNSMLAMMDQSSGIVAMAADSFDGIMQTAIDNGIDPQEFAKQLFGVTTKLAQMLSTKEMQELLDGGMFDVQTLKIMGAASAALVESNQAPRKKVGLFGMMREMKNSDMQKAIGFLTTFGRLFGKKLG